MEKEKVRKVTDDDEVFELFLENINKGIDDTVLEIMEQKGLTASRVLEDYKFQIKRALFISRNEL